MLRELRVQDFALIDELQVAFEPHLNILTGETGAGKSLLVDAVALILGGRGSPDVVRSGKHEAVIEASFLVSDDSPAVLSARSMGYEVEGDIVIQRVFTEAGKGRVYLNGRPITVAMLAQITEHLVDLHSQHDHQSLLRAGTPMMLLDGYGHLSGHRDRYATEWAAWSAARRCLEATQERAEVRAQEVARLSHEVDELTKANLRPGEWEALNRERAILDQVERLAETIQRVYERLHQQEGSVLGEIQATRKDVEWLAGIDPRLQETVDMTQSAGILLQDVAQRVRDYSQTLSYQDGRLEAIETRLAELQRLTRKYGAATDDDLMALLETKRSAYRALEDEAEGSVTLGAVVQAHRARLELLADELHQQRMRSAAGLSMAVNRELDRLKMMVRFEARVERRDGQDSLGLSGADQVEFLIQPNPGETWRPLRKVASGGELSRIMLALKTVVAGVDRVPTLVFDEVDTGVGGGVAEVVGRHLRSIAEHHQVLCVTHLPQVASGAQTHVVVEKAVMGRRTTTRARRLAPDDRIREIARMLAGEEITPTALRHAEEMIQLVSSRSPEAVPPASRRGRRSTKASHPLSPRSPSG